MKQSKLMDAVAEFRLRLSIGQGLVYEIRNAFVLAVGIKVLFETTLVTTIILASVAFVLFYLFGWIDLRYLRLFQRGAVLSTGKYNPHLKKIDKILKRKI